MDCARENLKTKLPFPSKECRILLPAYDYFRKRQRTLEVRNSQETQLGYLEYKKQDWSPSVGHR